MRNYRVPARKIANLLDFRPVVTIEESVANSLSKLHGQSISELENPRHYNIRWLKLLEEAEGVLGARGALWSIPAKSERNDAGVRTVRSTK